MKKKIITLLTVFAMAVGCMPQALAESETTWLFSDFSESVHINVTDKSCADGIVTITGIADRSEYVSAAVYSGSDIQNETTLIAIGQTAAAADGSFNLSLGLAEGTVKGTVLLSSGGNEPISATLIQNSNNALVDELETMKEKLSALAAKCEAAGIPIDYAKVKTTVVDKFTQFLNEDLANGETSRVTSHFEVLQKLYNEAYAEMSAYLSGDKIPESVPRYVTSANGEKISGRTIVADTMQDGTIKQRPIFYVGYGHWDYAESSVDYFDDMGVNFLHAETGPSRILFHPDPAKDWSFVSGGFLKEGSKIELAPGEGVNGCAVRIVNTTTKDTTSGATHPYGYLGISQNIEVEPNKTYNFSFKIKGTGIDTGASYYQIGSSGRYKFSQSEYNTFTKISGQYKTGANETSITIRVIAENPNTEILLDDFNVNKIWTSKNLISNPGFEEGEGDKSNLRDGFKIGYDEINRLKTVLKKAEDNNVAVALLLSLHYFPAFVTAEDSDMDNNGLIYTSFMPVNPTHPRVQEVYELFVKILMEELGDYKSLESIVLANEPAFVAGHGGGGKPNYYYLPQFREFLKNKYGTISNLNSRCKTDYASFDEVNMPEWGSIRKGTKTKLTIDYIEFNDNIVLSFHKYLSEAVKAEKPDMKVQTKIMAYLHQNAGDGTNVRSENGNEYESLSKVLDLNGHDGGASPGKEDAPFEALLQWFDFQRSVKDAPMFNMEDHSMSGDYSADKAKWIYGYLWQGAIHGRGGTALWRWTRDEKSMTSFQTDTNFATRPAETAAVGKAALDLNRFAEEITAIEKRKAHVAIFYSDKTNCWNNNYLNALYKSYCDVIYSGQKVDYITEYSPEKMNSGDYDLLVVPYATCVPKKVLEEIITFKNNGGKVVLTEFGSGGALSLDEYGTQHAPSIVSEARNGCEIVRYSSQGAWYNDDWNVYDADGTVSNKIRSMIREYVRDADLLQVKDAATGELIDRAEYACAEDENGDVIVNIYSFDTENAKNINVYYNGNKVTSSTELISGEDMGGNIILKPYMPLLLKLGGVQKKIKTVVSLAQRVGDDVEITSYNLKKPMSGTIAASFEIPKNMFDGSRPVKLVIASYESGKMTGCTVKVITPDSAGTTAKVLLDVGSVSENTKIKTFVWSDDMRTLADKKEI